MNVKYVFFVRLRSSFRPPYSKMAARFNAAAAPGPKDGAFMSFNVVCSSQNIVDLPVIHKEFSPKHIYDRQSAFWISATHTNMNSHRRLLRSYKALFTAGAGPHGRGLAY